MDGCYDALMKLVAAQLATLADDDEPSMLSANEEQELSGALAEIDSGRFIDGWKLLEELKGNSQA